MRLALPLCIAFLALAAAPALAHDTHGSCTTSRSLLRPNDVAHVDLYTGNCLGATVTTPLAWCGGFDPHVFFGIHTPVLNGDGCETGALWSPREAVLA